MQGRQLSSAMTTGKLFQRVHVLLAQWAGTVHACRDENVLESKNLLLGKEHTRFSELPCGCLAPFSVVHDRLSLNGEFETETRNALVRPVPHRLNADATDDLSGLPHVVKTLAFLVDIGRRFHPGRLPGFLNRVTKEFLKEVWLMALPGLGTYEAGPDLTGQSPAFAGGNDGAQQPLEPFMESEDTSGPDWRSDATGFYE